MQFWRISFILLLSSVCAFAQNPRDLAATSAVQAADLIPIWKVGGAETLTTKSATFTQIGSYINTSLLQNDPTVSKVLTIDSSGLGSNDWRAFKIVHGASQGGGFFVQKSGNDPFIGFCGFDSGTVRDLFFGGGGWNVGDANQISFWTDSTYSGSVNEGQLRMRIYPTGGVSIASTASDHSDPGTASLYIAGHIEVGYNSTETGYILLYDTPANGGQYMRLKGPANITTNGDLFLPDNVGDTLMSKTSTDVVTNKTFDASGTGNVLKQKSYIPLTHPDLADGTGATLGGTSTSISYGRPTFSNSADQAANYVEYYFSVPTDVDTSVTWRAIVKFRLGGADTGTQRFVLSVVEVSDSADPVAAALGSAVNLDFTGDASGANGDIETVGYTTLTGWAGFTADRLLKVRLARDGDAAQDTSTVDSTVIECKLEYGSSQ